MLTAFTSPVLRGSVTAWRDRWFGIAHRREISSTGLIEKTTKHRLPISVLVCGCFLLMLSPACLLAGQIGLDAFTSSAATQDFSILGAQSSDYVSPLFVGADRFDGDDHLLRSSGKFGPTIGRSGTALSNNPSSSSASTGFIEIILGNPAIRSGVYVGAQFSWAANVEFYDTHDSFLGVIPLSGNGEDSEFAGWEADDGLIGSILIVDASSGTNNPLIVDDLIQEIPEPQTVALAMLAFVVFRRWQVRE